MLEAPLNYSDRSRHAKQAQTKVCLGVATIATVLMVTLTTAVTADFPTTSLLALSGAIFAVGFITTGVAIELRRYHLYFVRCLRGGY